MVCSSPYGLWMLLFTNDDMRNLLATLEDRTLAKVGGATRRGPGSTEGSYISGCILRQCEEASRMSCVSEPTHWFP